MTTNNNSTREFLRHAVATVAYRGGKALRGAPESFASFDPPPGGKTPAQILAHMGDLYDWALSMARGKQEWHNSTPLKWAEEVQPFFKTLQAFDDFLPSNAPLSFSPQHLFQA